MAKGAFQAPQQSVGRLQERRLTTGAAIRDTTKEDQARIDAANNAVTNAGFQIAQGANQLVGQATQLSTQIMESRAIGQVTEDLQSVRDSLSGKSEFQGAEQSVFGKDAMENPDFRNTLVEMKKVGGLERTGRVNRDQAVERLNEIVATAKSRNPIFADSIERAARDVLGFSPTQEFAKQILSQTPEEQAWEQLRQKAARLGITPEQVQVMELSTEQVALQKARFELLKTKGQYNANVLGQEVRAASAIAYAQIADNLQSQIVAGGITDAVGTKSFIQQQYGAQRARLLANMPNNVDASLVNSHITTLQNEESRLLKMVDDGSITKFLQQNKEIMIATAEEDLLNIPVLGKVYATLGDQAGAEVMSTIAKFKDNPKALEAIFRTGGAGAGELSLGFMLEGADKAMEVIAGNRQPVNDDERRVSSWFAVKKLQNNTPQQPIPPQEAVRLVDIVKESGEDVSIASFSDPRIVRTVSATKEVHPQLINLQESYVQSLTQEYQDLKARGELPVGDLVVENGIIVSKEVPEDPINLGALSLRTGGIAPQLEIGGSEGSAAYNRWVTKANRLLKLSDTYKATGVIPSSTYTNANSLLKTLTTGLQETGEAVPAKPTVIKWGLDANGLPVRITE